MPEKSPANPDPEEKKKNKTSEPLPKPSPDVSPKGNNDWEKEETSGKKANPVLTEIGTPNNESSGSQELLSREERTWAVIAHLSVLLNLVTGFLGGIAALVIYFVYRSRSRFVAYHAMQSFIFQTIAWLGGGLVSGILIAIGGAFSFLILPLLCLIPGFLVLLLIPISLIYGVIGAVQVNNGEDFRFWLIGDWVRSILEPH